ncbi:MULTISPECIES: type I-C CRISPR-associated endonuclease Cas1c [Nitrosomonas]|uniref:type I-C CRISPR-associated endonuclease Cas1c n=1 Tax=Nitrosomonas TaxID=914 RepID=UPI000897FB0D|nr:MULTISPECIES: type I-C CRISPR-associated endonuclease Cas1c [Nitrosomonas]MXS81141.1 type I-C CRISPR-associated endonuclease Cas1 [Nitrosomonas sp. GH22]SDW84166.1 CRISPR-associated protein, Cas1 family [Nitrosomonas eutropha]SEI97620.1 CRISPR-associated protein, Cas1 family [Nitrosomonas eutropha]
MRQILNTLYILTPNAYAHLENDTLRIDVEREKKLQVPLHHLGSVVCFGNVLLSPALMHRCADNGISLVLVDANGRFKARLEGSVSGNVLLRQAQHRKANDKNFALATTQAIIAGKLRNARQVLLRGARESNDEADQRILSGASESLAFSIRSLPQSRNLDHVRGIEGDAAKTYFSALPHLVRKDIRKFFTMDGRTRRPPRDRFNAMLSFIYSMVMNDCRSALESVGLDPQIGFLHAIRPGRAALALDLMEEFRAFLADRLVLTLINRGQITAQDLQVREGGAVHLEDKARKAVVVAYQERKQEEVTHPLLGSKVPIGLLPQLQARFMARVIRGEMDGYLPFLTR